MQTVTHTHHLVKGLWGGRVRNCTENRPVCIGFAHQTHIMIYIHTYTYTHIYIHMCMSACVCVYIHTFKIYTHNFLHTHWLCAPPLIQCLVCFSANHWMFALFHTQYMYDCCAASAGQMTTAFHWLLRVCWLGSCPTWLSTSRMVMSTLHTKVPEQGTFCNETPPPSQAFSLPELFFSQSFACLNITPGP